ncbi:efflux RND transporter periplasmic adaptor subunit [Leptothoe sp. LEGE 181152]|uniref:Efflux RND transporter periplasmic adaptor subunit n=1 Tax=Adonisia turfae CCMR0081 TaxID=2292702 RepID=A0A6M0RV87_9CYAN|nr:efflux RND transporter periplasmic adaptor subunit [Adonisia turfae]MDV3352525.1 efflux RND transporter periplasmic adaptor subunit [Leptothoe sp. LEGE 181152]NEZ59800.1 efflux RND transporter periplasmic adaptor subunit [Adonisia turfae CCMR0081]
MVSSTSDTSAKRPSWHWLWLLPVLVAPAIWLGRFRSGSAVAEDAIQPLPVQTQALERVNEYQVERTYTGEIVARRSSDLGFEQAGTLVEVLVDEGDTVAAGAPLARLDTRSLQAQRQQIEAQRRQAQARFEELERGPRQEDIAAAAAAVQDLQAQLDLARLQQVRRENLYIQGAISLEERDEATFGADALESRLNQAKSQLDELNTGTRVEQVSAQDAQVDQIEASLKNLDVSIAKSVIYAPFDGRVSLRLMDEGVVVSPGQTIMRLVEGNALEARIGVPRQMASRINSGDVQTVEVDGASFEGRVTALLPELDDASQTVTVVMALPPAAQPTIGATARLELQDQQNEIGYWLPTSALVAGERGLWSAYVLDEAESDIGENLYEVSRREVEVLYTESDRAFVRGLLQPGEEIITSGTHRLVPGQLVKN